MTSTRISQPILTLLLCLSAHLTWGQSDPNILGHILCVWPEADSLLEWSILRAQYASDCEHFMTDAQTSAPHEDCSHLIAYRNGHFMHVPAVDYGVYVFLGSDVETDSVKYTGILRLGSDALQDWPGQLTNDSLPILNMNWLWTPYLHYSFCD